MKSPFGDHGIIRRKKEQKKNNKIKEKKIKETAKEICSTRMSICAPRNNMLLVKLCILMCWCYSDRDQIEKQGLCFLFPSCCFLLRPRVEETALLEKKISSDPPTHALAPVDDCFLFRPARAAADRGEKEN
jgi:hypothetical protein